MSDDHLSELAFDELDLHPTLRKGIEESGFENCTPIQALTLPLTLAGKDVAGQAQTGTGKTAAFLLSLFNRLLKHPAPEGRRETQPRAVVLAPTRELAVQIEKDARELGKHTGLKMGLVFGGTGYESQRQMLEAGVDVLIGTPGRLIDYFRQGVFDMKAVQVVVLDEADRMFDLGFIKDIRFILRRMPDAEFRQNLLFSATLSQKVLELAYEHMNEPTSVKVEAEQVTADRVKQVMYYPANEEKIPLLVHLLRRENMHRTMVFVNTKRAAEDVEAWLQANGIKGQLISGDVPQKKRLRLMKEFSAGELPVLVATDVASRGLHIPDVSHVVNFDLPQDAEDYVHRIGRTARAGAAGDAISMACEHFAFSLPAIEEYIGFSIPAEDIDRGALPELERPDFRKIKRGGPRRGGGGGRRASGSGGGRRHSGGGGRR